MPTTVQLESTLIYEIEKITRLNMRSIIGWKTYSEALKDNSVTDEVRSALIETINESKTRNLDMASAVFVIVSQPPTTHLHLYPKVAKKIDAYDDRDGEKVMKSDIKFTWEKLCFCGSNRLSSAL